METTHIGFPPLTMAVFVGLALAALLLDMVTHRDCRFQKTAALNVRSRLHYSSGGVGSIRQRRAA
ncbi:hypothetical protein ACJ5XB_005792, partial [Pseudomonas aeruginosa]